MCVKNVKFCLKRGVKGYRFNKKEEKCFYINLNRGGDLMVKLTDTLYAQNYKISSLTKH